MTNHKTEKAPSRLQALALLAGVLGAVSLSSCQQDEGTGVATGSSKGTQEGIFGDGVVFGLDYAASSKSGTTDAEGRFSYLAGERITFSLGKLVLGSTKGKSKVTPVDLVPGAADAEDRQATNLLVLLQSFDQDGDLNNGIRISPEISKIASKYGERVSFDQKPDEFAGDTNVAALLEELNAANVFTDTDPRPRTLRGATAAQEYFARAGSERRVVDTQYGKVSGFAANAATWQWLGIPYAKPPLGELRWKPPQEPEAWSQTRDAVAWSDQAAQSPANEASGEGGMSEDSLYLNVTAPDKAANLPVMVWFHGGAFAVLTGNSKSYNNPDSLTNKGVVLVVVNHRLGPFGYLAHPLLTADSSYGGSGNYGQMDLVMALSWVKSNIANFGGDPKNVTIFGQSGGCGKVASLMTSPMAAGLFHRAICQSGASVPAPTSTVESVIAATEEVGKALFTRLGISSVEQARAVPWTAIIQSETDANVTREVYRPTVDNHYISKTFYNTIKDGQPSDVPLMIGSTAGDYPTLITGLKAVMPFRSAHSKSNLYVYKFSRVPPGWAKKGWRSGHAGELPYLFNSPRMFVNNYQLGLVLDASGQKLDIGDLNGDGMTGSAGDAADIVASAGWDAEDSAVAETLMTVWTNFAKTANPSTPMLTWPAYTEANDTYVEFGTSPAVKTGLAAAFP